jgi:hypothetical protein
MGNGEAAGQLDDPATSRGVKVLEDYTMKRGLVFGSIIIAAMLAFELFNYTTTDFALTNLLGDLRFIGIRWATILAIAFCGMDFAGIARLFTPERGQGERAEVWYLLGAWFLAATMNAMLTWWSVSLALVSHQSIGDLLIGQEALLRGVPLFVAALVWLLRILLIGSFTLRAPSVTVAVGQAHRRARASNPSPDPQGRVPARLIRRGPAPAIIGQFPHDRHTPRVHSR